MLFPEPPKSKRETVVEQIFAPTAEKWPWLRSRTIFLTLHGSHAYGMNRPDSDTDVKGICIPPVEHYLGLRHHPFEQAELHEPIDLVLYELQKFVRLAAACNPNLCEVLFSDPKHYILVTPAAQRLIEARQSFISKKARWSFAGYANDQLHKIETHRKWLFNPPLAPPERSQFGLPERSIVSKEKIQAAQASIRRKIENWEGVNWNVIDLPERIAIHEQISWYLAELSLTKETQWEVAAKAIGFDANFVELIKAEQKYLAKKNEWDQYQEWLKNRNPQRAALEQKFGYDTKHGSHLVRLLTMALEITRDGKVIVNRPDAAELLAIRDGAWSYSKLVAWAESQHSLVVQAYETSPLPETVDMNKIEQLVVDITRESLLSDT